jgi:hypothetical protein
MRPGEYRVEADTGFESLVEPLLCGSQLEIISGYLG